MADAKITELTELTAVQTGDLLAIVDDPSGTPVTKKITVDTLSTLFNTNSMARQAIINGNFDVWQRGVSFNVPDVTIVWSSDRFFEYASKNGGTLPTLTRSRTTLTPGGLNNSFYGTRLTTNGAGTSLGVSSFHELVQKIEFGTRYLCGDGKKVTLSFWAKSDIANKKIGISLIQNYGTGGSPTSSETISGTSFTLTSTLTKYTYTFTTNTLTGKTFGTNNDDYIELDFWYMWGDTVGDGFGLVGAETYVGSGTIDIAQVQLCAGDVALPFMPKSFEEELRACMRYYEKSFQYEIAPAQNVSSYAGAPWWAQITAGATQTSYFVPFKVLKRITPATITLYNPVAANAQVRNFNQSADCTGSVTNHSNGQTGIVILATNVAGAAAGHLNVVHWSADAEL